jgi:hypothetical protein
MKLGTGNRKQSMMAGVLGVLALGAGIYLYESLFASSAPAPATPAPTAVASSRTDSNSNQPTANNSIPAAQGSIANQGSIAKSVGTTSAALDPTLHMDAMLVTESVEYSGSGRNIFSASSAPPPVVIQKPIASARMTQPVVQPCPPNCPPPPPPPPPPPIDLKFFGTETSSNGTLQVFLLHEDNVFLASVGDVVLRRYRLVSITTKSIQVEDMQYKNTQTLPLLTN